MRAFTRTVFIVIASLFIGIGLAKIARADGYASYKDERPVHPVFQHRNSSAELKRYLTTEEKRTLKRIHRAASARMNGRVARKRRVERIYVAEPRRRYIESIRYERDARDCRPAIPVEGRPRGTYARAEESAYNAWENSARTRHGYAYGNRDNARGDRPDCNPIRKTVIGTKVWVCSFVARPCRDR